jgi:transposase
MVILHRRQHDPATRDHIARRVAEGKCARDASRILKRYLARHLYRVTQNAAPSMT